MSGVIDGQALRAIRRTKGWSQRGLAAKAQIPSSTLSRLERKYQQEVRSTTLTRLAEALQVPVEALLVDAQQNTRPVLVAELAAEIDELARLDHAHQRQVASILHAYIVTLPR